MRCSFCYQRDMLKSQLTLDKGVLASEVDSLGCSPVTTIMGGESLLLDDLDDYVKIVACGGVVRLITNGTLLSQKLLLSLSRAGLHEIAISARSVANYRAIREKILEARNVFPKCHPSRSWRDSIQSSGVQINIPPCSPSELRGIIQLSVEDGLYALVCTDMRKGYRADHNFLDEAVLISRDGGGLETWEVRGSGGMRFGVVADHSAYDCDDRIVSPLGSFDKWNDYYTRVAGS